MFDPLPFLRLLPLILLSLALVPLGIVLAAMWRDEQVAPAFKRVVTLLFAAMILVCAAWWLAAGF